ncbi:MAG TPA: 50S ribosomal protein L28 [Candidatus Krumholzibacteria bacterium]|nr:50S ribosomal protein L28 [Candidatus Krumholzibacteria bacterium]
MSRRCSVCEKGPTVGHKISHAHNLTKRRWLPNLQKIRIEIGGRVKSAYVCTACIRTGKIRKVV